MFETPSNNFLPELEFLLEVSRAKKCRKHSFLKKHFEYHLESACLEQNQIRSLLKKIIPQEMRPVEDPHYGIDYLFGETSIDQKFSFGALGENTIKIRVYGRRLINNSNWTMIINKNHTIELFPTAKLAMFVKRNWGIVQRKLVTKKQHYWEYAIRLNDFYKIERIKPIYAELETDSIITALNEINNETQKTLINEAIELNKTILCKPKMICFEPILAKLVAKEALLNL